MCNLRQISFAEENLAINSTSSQKFSEFHTEHHKAPSCQKISFRLVIVTSKKSEIIQKDLKYFQENGKHL